MRACLFIDVGAITIRRRGKPVRHPAGTTAIRTRPTGIALSAKPAVTPFFDPAAQTIRDVVKDPECSARAVLDLVPTAGRTGAKPADAIIVPGRAYGFSRQWQIEARVHADQLWAALLRVRSRAKRQGGTPLS